MGASHRGKLSEFKAARSRPSAGFFEQKTLLAHARPVCRCFGGGESSNSLAARARSLLPPPLWLLCRSSRSLHSFENSRALGRGARRADSFFGRVRTRDSNENKDADRSVRRCSLVEFLSDLACPAAP